MPGSPLASTKPRLALPAALLCKLARMPETGMGYQMVDLVLRDKRQIGEVVVYTDGTMAVPERTPDIAVDDILDIGPVR